jgi:hypothetical protein
MTARADPPHQHGRRQIASETLAEIDAELVWRPLATVRSVAALYGVSRSCVQDRRDRLIAAGLLPKRSRSEVGMLRNQARFAQLIAAHPERVRPRRRSR